jgi:cbb3-type cytochrome oxidase subunit 3
VAVEYIQFVGALIFLLGILIGSYWFVYAPTRRRPDGEDEGRG